MQAVLQQLAPGIPVINLISNAPCADPLRSSFLLAALRHSFPSGSIFLSVVDPGVGGSRLPLVLEADGQYFVGPDNGLFNTVARLSQQYSFRRISWQPENCSRSFHGRDIFAPVAADLALGKTAKLDTSQLFLDLTSWPADLGQIIYFDSYGNAWTGIRYQAAMTNKTLYCGTMAIAEAAAFCAVEQGDAFWYCNSAGMIEIAVNQGNARQQFALNLGDPVKIL